MLALGGNAFGALAAMGGNAFSFGLAFGGNAFGGFAIGGHAEGTHVLSGARQTPNFGDALLTWLRGFWPF